MQRANDATIAIGRRCFLIHRQLAFRGIFPLRFAGCCPHEDGVSSVVTSAHSFAVETCCLEQKLAGSFISSLARLSCVQAPVNPADVFSLMGVYPGFTPASLPAVPGLEGMGVVEAVGEGATKLRVGQRVVPLVICGE